MPVCDAPVTKIIIISPTNSHLWASYFPNTILVKTDTGIWNILYNVENRPVSFSNDEINTVIECTYDSQGRRSTKKMITNGAIVLHHRYIYHGYLQIACIDLTRTHHPCLWCITWDPTQLVAPRPLSIQKDNTWYTYGWDSLKNVYELYNSSGYIKEAYSYTPYGQQIETTSYYQPLLWSSEMFDQELGLICYNYRYYQPNVGRWNQQDPIGVKDSMNLYAYTSNSPIAFFDLLGLLVYRRPKCSYLCREQIRQAYGNTKKYVHVWKCQCEYGYTHSTYGELPWEVRQPHKNPPPNTDFVSCSCDPSDPYTKCKPEKREYDNEGIRVNVEDTSNLYIEIGITEVRPVF